MPNGSPLSSPSSVVLGDGGELTAVLAHSMLGTVSAIGGAIALAMADEPNELGSDSLLRLAMTRLEFLTQQLRDLAAGIPGDAVPAVDPARNGRDSIVEDGTAVELYNAFDRTWSAGFQIASATDVGYRVRRVSDGSTLPGYTSRSDLRAIDSR
jgi:hypothetical protein